MTKLNERRKAILRAIIQSHIDLNIPIGSILITQRFSVGLSPATIRSTMAKLDELGYITQPHTSAGRVPTEKGYRFYVDILMEEETFSINSALSDELSGRLAIIRKDCNSLIKEAARTLSLFSRYLAIATPPRTEDIVLKRIKFIKYEKKKVLAILISEEGLVKNKIIDLDHMHSQKQLDRAANYLNNRFSGLVIKRVREKIAYQLYKEKTMFDQLIDSLLYLCKDIAPLENNDFSLDGLSGTSNLPDFATLKQIKAILRAIEDKNFMLKLLHRVSESPGTRVFVGMESILPAMKELSMVVSTFSDNKHASGAVGIIGPTRMNYKKMIPIVEHTAKALTQILSET
ncbi:MAG TPA: heat-inducible transcription repressor HrcA [Nitrospirae bacterium]|nr:heat-inducible transcription repressor HrcA [Nitrospirota bacterium]